MTPSPISALINLAREIVDPLLLNLDSDPLALTPHSKSTNKRTLEVTPPSDQNKSKKMESSKEIMDDADTIGAKMNLMISSLNNLNNKFNNLESTLGSKIDETNRNLSSIKEDIQAAKEDRVNIHKRVDELKLDVQNLKDKPLPPNMTEMVERLKSDLKADIMQEFKSEIDSIRETQHVNHLLDEIRRHDPGMIIFGHTWPNGISIEQVRTILRNQLNYGNRADSVTLKSATLLSSGRGVSPKPTVLVMFGSVSERDECLRQSFRLTGTNISFIKYMPKCFEQQYRKFREKAKNLRTALNVSTYIGFEKHQLVLKQKQKDTNNQKFGWVIFDSWYPQVTDNLQVNHQTSASNIGASPAIAVDALSNLIFIAGVKMDTSKEETETQLLTDFLGAEDKQLVEKVVVPKNGVAILHLNTGTDAKALSLKYDGREFKGINVKVSQG